MKWRELIELRGRGPPGRQRRLDGLVAVARTTGATRHYRRKQPLQRICHATGYVTMRSAGMWLPWLPRSCR